MMDSLTQPKPKNAAAMRILVTAKNAFREVLRERILYLVGLYALLLILSLRILPLFSRSPSENFSGLGLRKYGSADSFSGCIC